ncbi:MAG TPA: TolC family protein [Gemmatimonadaceae bacterium]|nr:TolC family protein [Gemmatimonadaceae bacterium]
MICTRLLFVALAPLAGLAPTSLDAQAARPVGALGAAPADTLRLAVEDAVARMLATSDEARLANAQVALADAAITSARSAGLPQLRLNSSYQQVLKNARAEIVGSVFGQSYTYNASLQLEQSIFEGGRVVAASQAASRIGRAATMSRAETRAQLAVDAQRVYLSALFTARIADIQRRNLALADERLAQVQQLEQAGRTSRYDVLRARVERANLEPLALQAESDRVLAELELKRLLDIPVEQPVMLTTALDPVRVGEMAEAAAANGSPAGIRPSVRAAELTARARAAGVRVARADLMPSISASFNLGYLALPSSPGFPSRLGETSASLCPPGSDPGRVCQNNGWFPNRNFGISMSWPIFDGLLTKGRIDLAQAQQRIADIELRRAREQAAIDVAGARAELARAQAAFAARSTNVSEAEEAFELATLRFERGIGTQLEVSDAQFALLNARSTEARATFDLYLAVAELARVRAEPIPLPNGGTAATGGTP